MAKKKKHSGSYRYDQRERRLRRVNPWVLLFLYFVVCSVLAYPLAWLLFNVYWKANMSDFDLLRLSVGLGIAGAAYFGVIAKAKREGRG